MRQYRAIISSIFLILFFGSVSMAATGLEKGFMQYEWGENIAKHEDLTRLYSKEDITFYSNPSELYTLDDISINNVVLGYYKRNLFAVYIGIDTLEVFDRIKQHMNLNYGLPTTKTGGEDQVTLKWKYKDITIKLKINEIDEKMKLAFYYRPLLRELKKDQFEELDDTSLQFFPIEKNKKPKMIPFLKF